METCTTLQELGNRLKPWKPELTLLGLPSEIRELIFEATLVETIKWDRRHRYDCFDCPRTSQELEYPTFHSNQLPGCRHYCKCRTRTSLNLLLVNRQVNAETAPVFWKKNTFCFMSMTEFAHDIGDRLRPEYREIIRHISFVDYSPARSLGPPVFRRFWDALLRCTGLRTLELSDASIAAEGLSSQERCRPFLRMGSELASLRSVKWLCYGPLSIVTTVKHPIYPEMIYWETTKEIDLEALKDEDDVERSNREFKVNFVKRVKDAMDANIFEEAPGAIQADPELGKLIKCFPHGLNDRHNKEVLDLGDDGVADVRFYGLPLSTKTLMHNTKMREGGKVLPSIMPKHIEISIEGEERPSN